MKKGLWIILAAALGGVLTGCGSSEKAVSSGDGAAAGPVTLKIHCDYTEEHPSAKILAQFIEKVETGTNGEVKIQPFYAGALGDYTTVFDEVAKGSIDMTWGCASSTYGEVFNLPVFQYLASNWEEAREAFGPESFVYSTMEEECDKIGIKLLSLHCTGAGGLASTKMPKDWETWGVDHGILLRVANTEITSVPIQEMGYRVQGINWSELFTAVQTGVVDGFVGAHPPICYDQFRDVIKYYIQINNFFDVATISIHGETFEKLTKEQQEVLKSAALWAFEESIKVGQEEEQRYMDMMQDYGIEVIRPSEEVLNGFAEKCRETAWPKLKDSIGEELYNQLVESYS